MSFLTYEGHCVKGEANMRKSIPLFILSSLFLLFPLFAQAEEIKLGYVDLQKALNDSEAGKSAKEKFKGEVDKAEQSLERRKSEVEKLLSVLQNQLDSGQSPASHTSPGSPGAASAPSSTTMRCRTCSTGRPTVSARGTANSGTSAWLSDVNSVRP